MNINVCPAVLADVDAIMAVERTGIAHPWTKDSIEALINDDNKTALKACLEDGTLVGYVGYTYVLDEAEVGNICVLPEYRGMGVGRKLFDEGEKYLKQKEIKVIFLEVESDNEGAIALYEKCGFVKYNARRNYYGEGRDALLYSYQI